MSHAHDLDERLMALEIKASYAEDLLDRLDQIIIAQQHQIDALQRELLRLRQAPPDLDNAGLRAPRDERPPHY